MHAYKDAIRRTGGAYILYPGESEEWRKIGFHEVIPGLGAFPYDHQKMIVALISLRLSLWILSNILIIEYLNVKEWL